MKQKREASDPSPEVCNCLALRQASRRVTQLYDRELAPAGIMVGQYAILARLGQEGPTSIQELAALLVMDRSTLGHLLRPLESRDLVTLAVAGHDRRSRTVVLTASGKALLAQARVLWSAAQAKFDAAFGREQAARARDLLKRIATMDYQTADGRAPHEPDPSA